MKLHEFLYQLCLPVTGDTQSPPMVGARLLNKDVRIYVNNKEARIISVDYSHELDELVLNIGD